MNLDLRPYIAIWAVVSLAVLVLLIRRKMLASREDDNLHVMSEVNPQQTVISAKLDVIDKWGKVLTVVAVLFGLAIAAAYVYSTFVGRGSLGE